MVHSDAAAEPTSTVHLWTPPLTLALKKSGFVRFVEQMSHASQFRSTQSCLLRPVLNKLQKIHKSNNYKLYHIYIPRFHILRKWICGFPSVLIVVFTVRRPRIKARPILRWPLYHSSNMARRHKCHCHKRVIWCSIVIEFVEVGDGRLYILWEV